LRQLAGRLAWRFAKMSEVAGLTRPNKPEKFWPNQTNNFFTHLREIALHVLIYMKRWLGN